MKIEVFYMFHVVELNLIYWEEVLYLDLNIAPPPQFFDSALWHCSPIKII